MDFFTIDFLFNIISSTQNEYKNYTIYYKKTRIFFIVTKKDLLLVSNNNHLLHNEKKSSLQKNCRLPESTE